MSPNTRSENPSARARQEQTLAANPALSAFVSAHAGTGKTKLLTDRLLRLMLTERAGDPSRILCLTFTKAAAAEMAIRLHKQLGTFATAADPALNAQLKDLRLTPDADTRARARALFARVLDLPGGMRIGTIHAFCQSLLRRFPLEAQISPHFRLVEDADARAALDQAREAVLPVAAAADIAALAGLITADGFASLVGLLERNRERLRAAIAMPAPALRAALRRAARLTAPDEARLVAGAVAWADEPILRDALQRIAVHGSPGVAEKANKLIGWLNLPPPLRADHWEQWTALLLTKEGAPRAVGAFCNPVLARTYRDIPPTLEVEQARVAAILEQQRALACVEASAALLTLAAPVLAAYRTAKARAGLLDYEDLIRQTNALLQDEGAAWVKYKLDAGIDHLLLDEVQDTSPAQWKVTDALTEDFFAGSGARDELARTIFAVGDKKQSIYGFQGADPDEFARHQQRYERQVRGAGAAWHAAVLDVSFRSTAPVLALVDAVFTQPHAAAGVRADETIAHLVNRVGQAGSVMLWPLAPRPAETPPAPWAIPTAYSRPSSALETLVETLADWIAAQTGGARTLESAGRPLSPGDVLILVRRRGDFDRALVRALKKRAVPVAGLDRMMLTEQPAVQDLMSLCEAILLPEDDLSLAEMLVSPLGNLSDDSLMALAAGRSGRLWETLRARAPERPDWQAAQDFFAALLARADFITPYALLAEALGPLGGRARLFARLGPEAAEPVDELLAAALHYAALHPPSLQGFLHWLRQSGAEIKREPDAAGDTVRIMTVHGAKGLEASLVILPDTTGLPPDEDRLHWTRDPDTGAELFLWAPRAELHCAATDALRATAEACRTAEHNRLLYVALTRARDHLLVCGWQPRGEVPPSSWYALAQTGLREVAGHTTVPHGWGEALALSCPQTAPPDGKPSHTAVATAPLPAWAGRPPLWRAARPPPEPALPRPLAPSRPEGIDLGPVPAARSPLLRQSGRLNAGDRGSLIHTLLQHLPELPAAAWPEAARRAAAASGPDQATAIAASVLAILDDPTLAPLFGPGSRAEQSVTGLVAGQVITGRIDRLLIAPDRILIADYKTARLPPAAPEQVPVLYLRQLAAYRAVLGRLYPDRPVICTLVWTEVPAAMTLPGALLDRHAPSTRTDPGLTQPPGPPTSVSHADPAGEQE